MIKKILTLFVVLVLLSGLSAGVYYAEDAAHGDTGAIANPIVVDGDLLTVGVNIASYGSVAVTGYAGLTGICTV